MESLAQDFFAGQAPLGDQHKRASEVVARGERPDVMRELCVHMAKLDFFSQAAPELAGGLGLSSLASGLVAEAAGGELVSGAWLDQLIAVRLISPLGRDVLAPILSAERLVSVAFDGPKPRLRWDVGRETVSGSIAGLHFGADVDRWVLLMDESIIIVDPHAHGVGSLVFEPGIDPLSYSISTAFDGVSPEYVLPLKLSERRLHFAHASCLVSAFSVGAAARCFKMAVAYVKEREQFGRAVGSFQAIKHRAANGAIDLLHTRSLVRFALAEELAKNFNEARIAADRCYRHIAESAIQMHGGIGFTSEVPIHLFLKNAQRLRAWPRPVDEAFGGVRRELGLDYTLEEIRV